MVGIENIKKIVLLGCEAVNVGSKVLNGGGLWHLASLIDDVNAVKELKKDDLIAEIKDLSTEERKELLELAKSKIQLAKPEAEQKIEQSLDLLNEVVDLGIEALVVYQAGKTLVEKAEKIIKA